MATNEIILYHYPFSPYGRRVVWYLSLRCISYTSCIQPAALPRPDLKALGVSYRRIPLMSIGRDVYLDSRHIIDTLESLYPPSEKHPGISATTPEGEALVVLLRSWTGEKGLFFNAAALMPNETPIFKDPAWIKDREDFSGSKWDMGARDRARPDALLAIRNAWELVEKTVLRDGRQWVLGGDEPSLVDIEIIWPFHWLTTLDGALPPSLISKDQYPLLFAYIARFNTVISQAAKSIPRKSISGPDVLKLLSSSPEVSLSNSKGVWAEEASVGTGLKKGDVVEVWPAETGFSHKDYGVLISLDAKEAVLERDLGDGGKGKIRIHAARHGFKLRKVKAAKI